MTAEVQLGEALRRFLKERHRELSFDPMDGLEIPLKDGQRLEVPIVFLEPKPGDVPE